MKVWGSCIWLAVGASACHRAPSTLPGARIDAASAQVPPALRIVSPMTGRTFTSSQIVFRWRPEAAGRVELARSADFATILHEAEGTGTTTIDRVEAGHWFWRVRNSATTDTSPVGQIRVVPRTNVPEVEGIKYGTDLNGDGLADLLLHQDVFLGRARIDQDEGRTIPLLPDVATQCVPAPADAYHPGEKVRCRNMDQVVAVGDVDGDGFDDLVAASDPNCVLLFRGSKNISAPWLANARYCPNIIDERPSVMAAGDLNGDGLADVVIAGQDSAQVLLSTPTGLGTTPCCTLPRFVALATGADMDGDGYDDIALLLDSGTLAFYRGSVTGPSGAQSTSIESTYPVKRLNDPYAVAPQLRMLDADDDGLADVIGIRPGRAQSSAPGLFMVPGATVFRKPQLKAVQEWPFQPRPFPEFSWDVLVGPGTSTSAIMLLADRGMGAGELITIPFQAGRFVVPRSPIRFEDPGVAFREPRAVGDVNGDGFQDLFAMVVDEDGTRDGWLYLGDGAGITTSEGRYMWPFDTKSSMGSAVYFSRRGHPAP